MIEWPFDYSFDLIASIKQNKPLEKKSNVSISSSEVQELSKWFTTAPKYTTFRVNTVHKNIRDVIEIIKNQLMEQSKRRRLEKPPVVKKDESLIDCIVINSWNDNEEREKDFHSQNKKEVIVDVNCGVAVLRGADIFAPGVVGMTQDTTVGDVVSVYADVSSKCLKGFMKVYADPNKKFLGYGVAKISRKALFERNNKPGGVAIEMLKTTSKVSSFICPSMFGILQNYPSIICGHVLDPKEGDLILDMCAAPGNKTTHIASLTEGKCVIIALDKSDRKIRRLKENCVNQKFSNITPFVWDSTKSVNQTFDTVRNVTDGPPFNCDTFDRVLLDTPCSALGQRPQLRNSASLENLNSYPNLQKKLFRAAVDLVRPNGILVYSTCTLLTQENEGIVGWALKQFPNIQLVPANPIVGSPGNQNCGLTTNDTNLVQKFGPHQGVSKCSTHQNDTIGFFIAKFCKINK